MSLLCFLIFKSDLGPYRRIRNHVPANKAESAHSMANIRGQSEIVAFPTFPQSPTSTFKVTGWCWLCWVQPGNNTIKVSNGLGSWKTASERKGLSQPIDPRDVRVEVSMNDTKVCDTIYRRRSQGQVTQQFSHVSYTYRGYVAHLDTYCVVG